MGSFPGLLTSDNRCVIAMLTILRSVKNIQNIFTATTLLILNSCTLCGVTVLDEVELKKNLMFSLTFFCHYLIVFIYIFSCVETDSRGFELFTVISLWG